MCSFTALYHAWLILRDRQPLGLTALRFYINFRAKPFRFSSFVGSLVKPCDCVISLLDTSSGTTYYAPDLLKSLGFNSYKTSLIA